MKILALELSSGQGSLALFDSGERTRPRVRRSAPSPTDLLFDREWPNDRKNSGPFFEHLTEVRKQFGKTDTIIVGLGPGSYAGTRIAISAAIGLSYGGTGSVPSNDKGRHGGRPSIRLIGFPSICAIDCDKKEYCVIGDARRQTFFFAAIRDNNLIEGPDLMTEGELREKLDKLERTMRIFTTEKLPQFERPELRFPSAKVLASLVGEAGRNFSQPPLEPMYLREPHITIPKK